MEERTIEYVRSESFSNFDAFVDRVTAADKSRLDIVRAKRSEVLGAFENNVTSFGNQAFVLEQPSKAYFLRNSRIGVLRNGLQYEAQRLGPPLKVGEDAVAILLLIVVGARIPVAHAVPKGVVE